MPLAGVPELAGDEQLVAWDARVGDCLADTLLVLVRRGGVNQPVTRFDRCPHRLDHLVRGHLEHAEPDLWDRDAVVEVDQGDIRHAEISFPGA